MNILRFIILMAAIVAGGISARCQSGHRVVADAQTRLPLPNASVFSHKGTFIGTTSADGKILCASPSDYPITIRYMGYHEHSATEAEADTIFLNENIVSLPEIVVEEKQHKMLHILAYVREYSTLSTYTDTITMFREKMVDFMLPDDNTGGFRGWHTPRILNCRSYYRFTDANGLDSVSDRCDHHFTWSDWVGIVPSLKLPTDLANSASGTHTIEGKYRPTEIWVRNDDRLTIDVNILADTTSRKWVPNLSSFFRNDNIDFEQFTLRLNYNNIAGAEIGPLDLTGYSFNIESRGRGRNMFRFNRHDQPFFVTTYTEAYILDKEFISKKEAKQWDKRNFASDIIEIFEPLEAPELQKPVLALIDRVNSIDSDHVRLSLESDHRLVSRNVSKRNFSIGNRALFLLKQLTGITYYKSHKKFNDKWRKFQRNQTKRNNTPNTTQNIVQ